MNKVCIVIGVVLAGMAIGCAKDSRGVDISLSLETELPPNGEIILFELDETGFNPLDTFEVKEDNRFVVSIDSLEAGFYRADIARQDFVNLILDGSESEITIAVNTDKKEITGSESSLDVLKIDELIAEVQKESQELQNEAREAQQTGDFSSIEGLNAKYLALMERQNGEIKELVEQADGSLVALYGLNYLDVEIEFDFYDAVIMRAEERYPDHFWATQLRTFVDDKKKMAKGQMAPDFELPTPEGEMIALSDLKGKYVLIDFWAAWCRPCRQENPNVVSAYQKYAGENFEILGVSLDRTKEAWVQAIEEDGLPWKHVSDLQYFNSRAAQLYKINAIPATYLIDPEGKILDKNLRGPSLNAKLAELFGE